MFKKVIVVTTIIILLSLLAFWSPWQNWNISILETIGLAQSDASSGMQVYSTAGELEVYIDSEVVGNVTVEGSPLEVFEVEPGEHLVTIKRIVGPGGSSTEYFYEFNRIINFTSGVTTVIAYEIGPSEDFSGGYTIYALNGIDSEMTHLNIVAEPEDAEIFVNAESKGVGSLSNYEIDLESDYEISIVKEGYEPIEFNLLPEEEASRKLLKGMDLNVETDLFALPLEVREYNE